MLLILDAKGTSKMKLRNTVLLKYDFVLQMPRNSSRVHITSGGWGTTNDQNNIFTLPTGHCSNI